MADPRYEQAGALLDAFAWELDHCRQVRSLAMRLYDQLAPLHGLGEEERAILHGAALLHDIGWTVAGQKHHKHSYRLIKENAATLDAFKPSHIELLANVARYHRKSLPKLDHKPYAALSAGQREIVRTLAALLRVADGLDRPHLQAVRELECGIDTETVRIALTVASSPEAHVEGGTRKKELFETVFGRQLRIEVGS